MSSPDRTSKLSDDGSTQATSDGEESLSKSLDGKPVASTFPSDAIHFSNPAQKDSSHPRAKRSIKPPENNVTAGSKQTSSFTEKINEYQQQLESEFQSFKSSLKDQKPEDLEDLDWKQMEHSFNEELKSRLQAEEELMRELTAYFQHFVLWTQVSNDKELERATKRLRTRITFVQNSESLLAEKQDHYAKVLTAFQSAMALLGNL